MQDTEAVRRYWENERSLEGRRRPGVPSVLSPPERTWVWSDLHLSDRNALEAFDRGFHDTYAMNREILGAWRRLVREGDTIVCLGDVAHSDAWRDRRLRADILYCPGERVLVVGNHDVAREALRDVGFTTQHEVALYDADPPLALTHLPLETVPVGAVNLHGHHHDGYEPTRRHINMAIERWHYEPVPMETILARARERLG